MSRVYKSYIFKQNMEWALCDGIKDYTHRLCDCIGGSIG